ncbi:MAG: Ig-like domain-containing protein, partial [Spirosomataceae bacterium]
MKKFTYKFLGLTWLGGMLFIGSASGQQGPTSYSATSSAATSTVNNSISGFGTTTFPSANSYTVRYGEAGASTAGLNRTVNEFVLGGQTFVRLPRASSPFDQVTLKRRPNPVVVDPQRTALFFESPTAAAPATVVASGTPLYLSSNVVTSYESALNSYIVNRGAENLFTNTNVTTGTSNVERLDLILNKGFTVKNTTTEGFLLLERGGDDTFKYAAITELDVFGNVKTLGALKTFSNTSNWSNTGINFKSTVVQKNSTDALQRPSGNVAAEEVKGTFLTMQDLGISAGTTFFGIVIFHSDVTSSMDLIGLTDIPVNSGASLDLVGGSGIFSVPTVVNNICPTLTANLTSAFTTTNLPSGTVLTWHSGFPATNANRIANPAAVSNGLYYPAYFSSSLNCYSDAGIPVRVTIINCPPLAQNDNAETFANTPVNINVRLNDSDPEGLPLNNPTIISNPANGTVQVQANGTITYTPSPAFTGTNTFQYQVCDQGSPSLCATATVTVLVKNARIVANNDVSPQQNGASGGVAINTVLANDSLSNVPVVANLVTISAVGSVPSQLTFNTSTGQVSVNPGTPAGTYGFTYKICEIANPTNCDDATVSVPVGVAPIVAVDDTNPTAINGATGGVAIANVRTNDLLNGVPVTSSNVTTTLVGTLPAQLTFNPSTGQVSVNPGSAAGTYTFTYKICEVLNPTNCDEALVSVLVGVAPIVAVDDTNPTAINGATGGVAIA